MKRARVCVCVCVACGNRLGIHKKWAGDSVRLVDREYSTVQMTGIRSGRLRLRESRGGTRPLWSATQTLWPTLISSTAVTIIMVQHGGRHYEMSRYSLHQCVRV